MDKVLDKKSVKNDSKSYMNQSLLDKNIQQLSIDIECLKSMLITEQINNQKLAHEVAVLRCMLKKYNK